MRIYERDGSLIIDGQGDIVFTHRPYYVTINYAERPIIIENFQFRARSESFPSYDSRYSYANTSLVEDQDPRWSTISPPTWRGDIGHIYHIDNLYMQGDPDVPATQDWDEKENTS